ncbi:hypothetical protein JCM10207_006901 [Rhodosporidiobolus poonsookiae]
MASARPSPPRLRPQHAPLPPHPARADSLRRPAPAHPHSAQRDPALEAALENRRLAGVPSPAGVLRERQVDAGHAARENKAAKGVQWYHDDDEDEAGRMPYEGETGQWEDQADEQEEVLRDKGNAALASRCSAGGATVSRMNSTRRYMAQLDPDDDDDDEDAAGYWRNSGWGSDVRDSVASVLPGRGLVQGLVPATTVGRESTVTVASVEPDPFSYSMYESLPSPVDPAFPSHAAEPLPPLPVAGPSQVRSPPSAALDASTLQPIVRIGPPSPTASSFVQNPHESTLWREVTAAAGGSADYLHASHPPPPSPSVIEQRTSQSSGRVRSQTLSGSKNFSRPFAAAAPPLPPPLPLQPAGHPPQPNRNDSLGSSGTDLDRSGSLGQQSLLDRSSSLGHSSSLEHSSQGGHSLSASWEDKQLAGFWQHEEAKRAIALARSRSQRVRAEQRDFEHEQAKGVEELQDERVVPPLPMPMAQQQPAPMHFSQESQSSIHFPQASPPPPRSATTTHFSLSYYQQDENDDSAQYAVAHPPLPELAGPNSPLSHPRPPPHPPTPPESSRATPLPVSFSPHSPPSDLPYSMSTSPPTVVEPTSPPRERQRNVLRKGCPPGPASERLDASTSSLSSSQAMARAPSATSTSSDKSGANSGGAWSRFRARSRSRGAADAPRPDFLASISAPMPTIGALVAHAQPALVPPAAPSLAPLPATQFSPSSSVPLSQTEFARLAAARPAFLRAKTDGSAPAAGGASPADWVLKNVEGAHAVQDGIVAGEAGSRGVLVGDQEEEVERLSAAAHSRAPSKAPSLYSQYSIYSLPPDSPATPFAPRSPSASGSAGAASRHASPAPSPLAQAFNTSAVSPLGQLAAGLRGEAGAGAGGGGGGDGGGAKPQRASTTLDKLFGAAKEARSSMMERTASGREVRREPASPDDFLQLGIDLHEQGELERSAWCFEQSAKRGGGCGAGMLMYGLALRHGWGCQVNVALGFRYLTLAAESVVDDIDRVVFGGRTLTEAEANTRAAKSELVLALHEMGVSYRFGWGTPKDKKLAVSYFKLAADLGDADAQQDVAFMLANGKGCRKDLKAAARYYRLAIEQGAPAFGLSWVYKDKYKD